MSTLSPLPYLIVVHADSCPPAILGEYLTRESITYELFDLPRKWQESIESKTTPLPLPLPSLSLFQCVVSLGGPQDAYDIDTYPYIEWERRLIQSCISLHVPFLGICLGAQILADSIGGKSFKMPAPEVGFPVITPTADGKDDDLVQALVFVCKSATECELYPFIEHHQDSFRLPPAAYRDVHKAVLLSTSMSYDGTRVIPQIFKCGLCYGVQFHPEASVAEYRGWLSRYSALYPQAEGVKKTLEQLVGECEERAKILKQASWTFFEAWGEFIKSIKQAKQGEEEGIYE